MNENYSHFEATQTSTEASKEIELLRYDDCWRPLIDAEPDSQTESKTVWQSAFGGTKPYNQEPTDWIRPMTLDAWGDPGTLQQHAPAHFKGELDIEPIKVAGQPAKRIQISLTDLRDEQHPIQRTFAVQVGFRIPYEKGTRAFGSKEMYLEPEVLDGPISDPNFPRNWYYLEAELFGRRISSPADTPWGAPYAEQREEIHCGAPLALFKEPSSEHWFALAGEVDYGAALIWRDDHVLVYTTLYLRPGDTASWSCCQWFTEEEKPENIYISTTNRDGFFDQLNPPGFERKGPPEGPIAFININRPEEYFKELEKVQPKLVILNYHYDHVSSVGSLYGEWTTYEGFSFSEEKLKALIARIKAMGAQVGFYGTQVEQPECHPPVSEDDIVLDAWGRRFHAWEPGNWVVDCGNRDSADRLARAEAEFAQYYGLECVFIDRQDHMSVNANPERQGQPGNKRLEYIPSVRLGLIELNKRRVYWQRKLNPTLRIGINNTTQWVGGVRYADFNLLEGGGDLEPPIFYLNAPFGIVHKQHYNLFFADYDKDVVDHGIVQGEDVEHTFEAKRQRLFRICLADGITPQPYEDEIFVAPDSQFAKGWNDRTIPDSEKLAFYDEIEFYGGESWHNDCVTLAPALEVANHNCFPVVRLWGRPDEGEVPAGCRFSAREGADGAFYIGVFNTTKEDLSFKVRVGAIELDINIPANRSAAWFRPNGETALSTCEF